MASLTIIRKKAAWGDLFRKYAVMVDGQRVAQLSNGGQAMVDLSPGRHVLWVAIDWCRSSKITLDVAEDDELVFTCGRNATPFLTLLYVTVLYGRYLWLRPGSQA